MSNKSEKKTIEDFDRDLIERKRHGKFANNK